MSLREAINNMCRHCIYDCQSSGNWRQQVEACTSQECPLFAVRPRSRGMTRVRDRSDEFSGDVQQIGTVSEHLGGVG
jgi:hypothetical protein